jgi:hypothetical protein
MLGLYLRKNHDKSNYSVTVELDNLTYIYNVQTREAAFQMLETLSAKDEAQLLQHIKDEIANGIPSGSIWDAKKGVVK